MSIFSRYSRIVLSILLLVAALSFLLPFTSNQSEGGEKTDVTGFALMSGADQIAIEEQTCRSDDKGVLFLFEDGSYRSFVHLIALLLLSIVSSLYFSLFDREGARKYLFLIFSSALGLFLSVWLSAAYSRPFIVEWEGVQHLSSGSSGLGLRLLPVLLICVLIWSVLSLFGYIRHSASQPQKTIPGRKLSWISRVAVLGAASAVLFYFEVAIIPPIYKLDLSVVPALIAGFAMGPGASLGVMAVKDLIGLLHTSSMGVGEAADFLMSGSMTVVASLVYLKRHTFKGAVLGLTLGAAAMALIGALANYFIMIPFYVQVMNMPMDVIVSLIAQTIPAVDNLWEMILFAVVPFNLFKGIVLAVVTLLLYKRLSPMLKRL